MKNRIFIVSVMVLMVCSCGGESAGKGPKPPRNYLNNTFGEKIGSSIYFFTILYDCHRNIFQ